MDERDFRAKGNGHKREYVFDFGKAQSCDHPNLVIVARGTNLYRCTECNYAHWIQSAITWPLHWIPIMGMFQMGSFVKEFGKDALEEVFRSSIGQMDGSAHKAVLPEGKTMMDILNDLDEWNSLMEGTEGERPWELGGDDNVPSLQEGEQPPRPRRRKKQPKP